MDEVTNLALALDLLLLLGGFGYAAVSDYREREVPDGVWQLLGVVGFLVGYAPVVSGGVLPIALWTVVGLFVLQHLFAWDSGLGPSVERYADYIELAVYVGVVVVILVALARYGIGSSAVPAAVLAVLVSVLFARGLFEAGIIYGGADAKAIMVAGLLVPFFSTTLLPQPASIAPVTQVLPFAVNVLMNAALCSLAIPIAIGIHNARSGEFRGISSFVGYTIPVDELPKRYVWVRDPMFGDAREEELSIETSEDDRRRRSKIADELRARGVTRVWVTPQVPFVVLLAVGVVLALLAGNLVFDAIFQV